MSSRGCPYRCHFCNNTEPVVRFFSPRRTIANAKVILDVVRRDRVFFVDDVFAASPRRMLELLDEADAAGLNFRARTQFFVHISLLDERRLDAIDAYDPIEVQVGIESGDDRMLAAMGKTFTAALAEDRLRAMFDRGRKVACLFLLGFPGETAESLKHTVDWVDRNRKYMSGWWVSYYQPVAGTKGWEMAAKRLGRPIDGVRNTEISYLDPDVTEHELTTARQSIMTY